VHTSAANAAGSTKMSTKKKHHQGNHRFQKRNSHTRPSSPSSPPAHHGLLTPPTPLSTLSRRSPRNSPRQLHSSNTSTNTAAEAEDVPHESADMELERTELPPEMGDTFDPLTSPPYQSRLFSPATSTRSVVPHTAAAMLPRSHVASPALSYSNIGLFTDTLSPPTSFSTLVSQPNSPFAMRRSPRGIHATLTQRRQSIGLGALGMELPELL
jgi:hypothetical protein